MAFNSDGISLARKYRPVTLLKQQGRDDVMAYIGNENAVRTVIDALNSPRKPQTVLLSGFPSCGKTSMGRLLIKEYLCENWTPETGACCQCDNCKEIESYILSGKTEDLLVDSLINEVNVAVDRGVKNIETILEEAEYISMSGETKAWIFDEFHRASPEAQSALLKIIEEPPENTLWIFCTTEPDKIDTALRTRFDLDLELNKPTMEDMMNMLQKIARLEGIKYDNKAFKLIIGRSNFVPRDAIHDIEMVLNSKDTVTYENTLEILQELGDKLIFDFLIALLHKDVYSYIRVLHEIKQKISIDKFVASLDNFVVRGVYVLNGMDVDGLTTEEIKEYKDLFKKFSPEQLCNLIQKILAMRGNVSAETQLLLLGYTGIDKEEKVNNTETTNIDNLRASLKKVGSEIEVERAESLKSVQENNRVDEKQLLENIDDLDSEADEEDILSLFSATKIER